MRGKAWWASFTALLLFAIASQTKPLSACAGIFE